MHSTTPRNLNKHTQARRRRPATLTVILSALALAATSLVIPSVAGAANTAEEVLYDHDDNSQTSSVRQFAGSDRYATATAIATEFLDKQVSTIGTIIVASGESLVDAAAAAGLAAAKNAPIVLTRQNRLHAKVKSLIDEYYITDIYIVGGIAVVSKKVYDELAELPTVDNVVRLSGPDRYATAIAIADEIGDDAGEYCLTQQSSIILANANTTFADIIAIGPLSFALALPILLTQPDRLPDDVEAYIVEDGIERVLVAGGTAAISAVVEASLTEIGIEDIQRIAGATRYDTAVAIADVIEDCANNVISLSSTTAALVNGAAPADGITAAPLLATGLRDDGVTPILLVSDANTLPSATNDYLVDTPIKTPNGDFNNFYIAAIGGTAVVSNTVVLAAIEAASNSDVITATIKAVYGSRVITIKFSDPVDSRTTDGLSPPIMPTSSVLHRGNYYFAGGPLLSQDTLVYNTDNRTLTITLSDIIDQNGDKFTVSGNRISGVGTDTRKVKAASFIINEPPPDRTRPQVEIFAAENAYEFSVKITEENIATDIEISNIQLRDKALPATAVFLTAHDYASSRLVCLYGIAPAITIEGITSPPSCNTSPPQDGSVPLLAKGDKIKVASGAVVDEAGNESRSYPKTVVSNTTTLRVVAATVTQSSIYNRGTDVNPSLDVAKWSWLPTNTMPQVSLTIAGKPGGIASGATGNAWRIDFVNSGASSDSDTDADIDIAFNNIRHSIVITYDDSPTLGEFFDALTKNKVLDQNFNVETVLATAQYGNTALIDTLPGTTKYLTGGTDQVILTLKFNDILREFHPSYLISENVDETLNGKIAAALGVGIFADNARTEVTGSTSRNIDGVEFGLRFRDSGTEVTLLYTYSAPVSTDSMFAPKVRDSIKIPRGTALSYAAAINENCGAADPDSIPRAGGTIPAGCHDWQTITVGNAS